VSPGAAETVLCRRDSHIFLLNGIIRVKSGDNQEAGPKAGKTGAVRIPHGTRK
jgi:hypothetical protein